MKKSLKPKLTIVKMIMAEAVTCPCKAVVPSLVGLLHFS